MTDMHYYCHKGRHPFRLECLCHSAWSYYYSEQDIYRDIDNNQRTLWLSSLRDLFARLAIASQLVRTVPSSDSGKHERACLRLHAATMQLPNTGSRPSGKCETLHESQQPVLSCFPPRHNNTSPNLSLIISSSYPPPRSMKRRNIQPKRLLSTQQVTFLKQIPPIIKY